eukprot:gene31593-39449_t
MEPPNAALGALAAAAPYLLTDEPTAELSGAMTYYPKLMLLMILVGTQIFHGSIGLVKAILNRHGYLEDLPPRRHWFVAKTLVEAVFHFGVAAAGIAILLWSTRWTNNVAPYVQSVLTWGSLVYIINCCPKCGPCTDLLDPAHPDAVLCVLMFDMAFGFLASALASALRCLWGGAVTFNGIATVGGFMIWMIRYHDMPVPVRAGLPFWQFTLGACWAWWGSVLKQLVEAEEEEPEEEEDDDDPDTDRRNTSSTINTKPDVGAPPATPIDQAIMDQVKDMERKEPAARADDGKQSGEQRGDKLG